MPRQISPLRERETCLGLYRGILEKDYFYRLFYTTVQGDLAEYFRIFPYEGFPTHDLRQKFRTVSVRGIRACLSCHAKENANGCPFGESLTGSVSPRAPRWVFDEAGIRGSRGFAGVMGSISTRHSANHSNSMKPSAERK